MLLLTTTNITSLLLSTDPQYDFEYYIVKDLCTGNYFIDTFYIDGSRYKGCMSFHMKDISGISLDAFVKGISEIIPVDFIMQYTIKELLGKKVYWGLLDSEIYKPCDKHFSYDSNGTIRRYWDLDVVLHYCSEHEDDLTQTGRKFYNARKHRLIESKELLKFDPVMFVNRINERTTKHVSVDGMLTLNFD